MGLHKNITVSDGHIFTALGPYANQSAREGATGLGAGDVDKVAKQSDNNTYWALTNHSPVTWQQVSVSGAAVDHGDLTGVTANQHHNQAHAIDGADHTGSLAHSALSGVGADDHHAHANKAELDQVSDGGHDVRTDNPHSVSAAQAGAAPSSHASQHNRAGSDAIARQTELLDVYESNNGQVVTSAGITIEFDTTRLNTDSGVFNRLGSTEIEFLAAGYVKVMTKLTVRQTAGTSRTITVTQIEHMPDGGSFDIVPGAGGAGWTRNNTDGHYCTVIAQCALQVGAGDRVRLYAERISGTGTIALVADGSNMVIEWSPS